LEIDIEAKLLSKGLAAGPRPNVVIDANILNKLREAILKCKLLEISYAYGKNGRTKKHIV